MRRNALRLLGFSFAVTTLAVCATAALLGNQAPMSGEEVRSALLRYANEHRTWAGVESLVRELAERTGQRIALTKPDGEPIAASGPAAPSTAPAIRIDAAIDDFEPEPNVVVAGAGVSLRFYQWQLTEAERRQRQALAAQAADCLRTAARPAGGEPVSHRQRLPIGAGGTGGEPAARLPGTDTCVPDELEQPTQATRELAAATVEQATACLDDHGLAYDVGTGTRGLPVVRPVTEDAGWQACVNAAKVAAKRSYVAAPADLYVEPAGATGLRTGVLVGGVLLAAAVVTGLAGRRLLSSIAAPALVGEVAHELRTPLANVRSQLEAAQDGVLPLDDRLIQTLIGESTLLERLVADLQDLALADAGRLRIHPEERDAGELAAEAVAAHRARAREGGVELRLDADGPVVVYADPARLRQALSNLVANAIRHTPEGGLVEITVRRTPSAVVLAVADTGCGIAPERLPRVFDRFYRVDPRDGSGAGLGLAIAKQLVEAHRGELAVTSSPGVGSTFTIRLPCRR